VTEDNMVDISRFAQNLEFCLKITAIGLIL